MIKESQSLPVNTLQYAAMYTLLLPSIAIDECLEVADCVADASCVNTVEGFLCLCPSGYQGDGRISGEGCMGKQEIKKKSPCIKV